MSLQKEKCQCSACYYYREIRPNEKRHERTIERTRDYEAIGYHFTEWMRIGYAHDGDYDQLKKLLNEKEFKRMLNVSERLCHFQESNDGYRDECYLKLGHHRWIQYGSSIMEAAQEIIGEKRK